MKVTGQMVISMDLGDWCRQIIQCITRSGIVDVSPSGWILLRSLAEDQER